MKASVASVTIVGIAPMTHSHQHGEPKFEGETHDDYDARTWRSKLNTETRDGKQVIASVPRARLPPDAGGRCALFQAPDPLGQGKATWTAKFSSGIALMGEPHHRRDRSSDRPTPVTISANVDGKRGSGKRRAAAVPGYPDWLEIHGRGLHSRPDHHRTDLSRATGAERHLVVGSGPVCPTQRWHKRCGRFRIEKLVWHDNRQLLAA